MTLDTPLIRLFKPIDSSSIYRLCFETALHGKSMEPFFHDANFIGLVVTEYYMRCEPDLLFVAEEEGRVVGYLTGCRNTRRQFFLYVRKIAPKIIFRFMAQGHWKRPLVWNLVFSLVRAGPEWSRLRSRIVAKYPAHCHMNLEAAFRGRGIGSLLLDVFLYRLKQIGVKGVHAASSSEGGKAFFSKAGFSTVARYPSPSLPGVPSEEVHVMVKKLL
jgi:GNAT superfamily N-acetyltransferase